MTHLKPKLRKKNLIQRKAVSRKQHKEKINETLKGNKKIKIN